MYYKLFGVAALLESGNELSVSSRLFLVRFVLTHRQHKSLIGVANLAKQLKLSNTSVSKALDELTKYRFGFEYLTEDQDYTDKGRPKRRFAISEKFFGLVIEKAHWLSSTQDKHEFEYNNSICLLQAILNYGRADIKNIRLTDKNIYLLIILWLNSVPGIPLVKIKLDALSTITGLSISELKAEAAKLQEKQLIQSWVTADAVTPSLRLEDDIFLLYPTTELLKNLTGEKYFTSQRFPDEIFGSELKDSTF